MILPGGIWSDVKRPTNPGSLWWNYNLKNAIYKIFFKKIYIYINYKSILQLTGNMALNRWVINDAPCLTAFSPSLKFAIECPGIYHVNGIKDKFYKNLRNSKYTNY